MAGAGLEGLALVNRSWLKFRAPVVHKPKLAKGMAGASFPFLNKNAILNHLIFNGSN